MSERDAQINVKMVPEKLKKWDRYIEEETDFATRSEFIRFAVNREVTQKHGGGEATDTSDVLLEEVRDSLGELTEQVDSMANQLDTLQYAVRSDPEIEELANELFSLIPDEKPGTPKWQNEKQKLDAQAAGEPENEEADAEARAWNGTPESFADALDVSEREIHSAIDLLIAKTHIIETDELAGGKKRYWTEV